VYSKRLNQTVPSQNPPVVNQTHHQTTDTLNDSFMTAIVHNDAETVKILCPNIAPKILSEGWSIATRHHYLQTIKVLYDQHSWSPMELADGYDSLCQPDSLTYIHSLFHSLQQSFCLTLRTDQKTIAGASLKWFKASIYRNDYITFRRLIVKRVPMNIREEDASFTWLTNIVLSKESFGQAYKTAGSLARFRMMEQIVLHTRIDARDRRTGDLLAYQLLENVQSSWSSLKHLMYKYETKLPDSFKENMVEVQRMEQLGHFWVDLDMLFHFYKFLDRLDKAFVYFEELQNRMELNDDEQSLLTRLDEALSPTPIQNVTMVFDPMIPYEPLFPDEDEE
jgi:hypothetical protein